MQLSEEGDVYIYSAFSLLFEYLVNLFSEASVLEWGRKIIAGEQRRQSEGGVPIYNPTMGRVSVVFEIFKEMYDRQHMLQTRTAEALANISNMRYDVDELIFGIWAEVENSFAGLSGDARIKKCAEYGVIYYYRPDRAKKKSVDD